VFVATGAGAVGFCDWVRRLGERAEVLVDGLPDGASLLHLEARALLATPEGAALRGVIDEARKQGVLVSLDLGPVDWIRDHGSSRTAYQLATLQPDVLFASQAAADELAAPLEGLASVPVLKLATGGCSVYGSRLPAPALTERDLDGDALAAAFCVSFVEGAPPLEAAGRAVLVAAMVVSA
jgi:sugar/nucleoside kinase (ribokinase family)